LLFLLGVGGTVWILLKRQQRVTERILPEEVGQTPLYAERCGASGKGGPRFQRLGLYDQGMVLAQDSPPVFLPYSELEEAWRTHLGPWSRVQVRVTEDASRAYYGPFGRALIISDRNVLAFSTRDPDNVLRILRDKGVSLSA
jgi:hypothetical protein